MTTAPGHQLSAARQRLNSGDSRGAQALFSQILRDRPSEAQAWLGYGQACAALGQFPEAIIAFERTGAIAGLDARLHNSFASAKAALGRFAEAETHFQEALRFNPDSPATLFNYATSRSFDAEEGAGLLERIKSSLGRQNLDAESKSLLHFAAVRLLDRFGDPDETWSHAIEANRLVDRGYAIDATEARLRRIEERLTADVITASAKQGARTDKRFIFIVGMPRTGSTLAEQILAAGDGYGAGELDTVARINQSIEQQTAPWPDYAAASHSVRWGEVGRYYAKEVSALAPDASAYIDKALPNFVFVGLIRMMLPDARIIWCRRDPLDSCLSAFFHRFQFGQSFSYNLDHLAFVYAWSERIMRHWSQVAGPVFELRYEDLLNDQEGVSKALYDFAGLSWTDKALNFHSQSSAVGTASKWQVRQTLNKISSGRSKRYKPYLGALIEALRKHGVDVDE